MTNPKSVNFIQEEDRIVTFDMDGTFVGELYPTYFEYNMLEYRVLMPETIIECRLERFFISTACISFSDKKGKNRGSIRYGNARNHHRAETASGKDIHLIFWPELIVFNPKMTIFIQINREIKK